MNKNGSLGSLIKPTLYFFLDKKPERALYGGRNSNEFTTKSSVTIKYGQANSNASH